MVEERDLIKDATHEFVENRFLLERAPAAGTGGAGLRVLGIDGLDEAGLAFADDYCEWELNPAAHPGNGGPGTSFSSCDQQGTVRGAVAAPRPAFLSPIPES